MELSCLLVTLVVCRVLERNLHCLTCTGDIVTRLHELQSLKVDETKDKDKQKSEAKSIVYRRRKALTDLFKALEFIGTCCCDILFNFVSVELRYVLKFFLHTVREDTIG